MKENWTSLWRRSWPVFVSFIIAGIVPLVTGKFLGWGWRLATGIFMLLLWLVLRPWRFGLLSLDERKMVRIGATINVAAFAVNYAFAYFKW